MNGTALYEETAISTQSKGRLVVMLYDGAVKFLSQAIKALQVGDLEAKNRNIGRARDIIFELNTVLDLDAGREVAQNLRKLYNFRPTHTNHKNSVRPAAGWHLRTNEAWHAR